MTYAASIFGNNNSFGFNLELECELNLTLLIFSLNEKQHINLSDILLKIDGKWMDIREIDDVKYFQSSIESSMDYSFSVENWMKRSTVNFFSTAFEKNPYIKFEIPDGRWVQRVSIGNRIDGLWERCENLIITAETSLGSKKILWDGRISVYPISRIVCAVMDIHSYPKNSSLFDKSAALFVLYEKAIASSITLLQEIKSQPKQADLVKSLDDLIDIFLYLIDCGDFTCVTDLALRVLRLRALLALSENQNSVILSVVYLLMLKERVRAYDFMRRVQKNFDLIDMGRLLNYAGLIGRHVYGYPLIITAHAFQRPLNSYGDVDLRKLISSAIKVLEQIPGVQCIMCYGTLLGAIRDNNFIEHDDDIDLLAIMDENKIDCQDIEYLLRRIFESNGYGVNIEHSFEKNSMPIIQISDKNYPVHLDIFLGLRRDSKVQLLMKNSKSEFLDEEILIPQVYLSSGYFEGFPVPAQSEVFLEKRYGQTWKIPDPLFRLKEI